MERKGGEKEKGADEAVKSAVAAITNMMRDGCDDDAIASAPDVLECLKSRRRPTILAAVKGALVASSGHADAVRASNLSAKVEISLRKVASRARAERYRRLHGIQPAKADEDNRDKDPPPLRMSDLDFCTGEAWLREDGRELRTREFSQRAPKKGMGSPVLATFNNGLVTQVRNCFWEVVLAFAQDPLPAQDTTMVRVPKVREKQHGRKTTKRGVRQAQDTQASNAAWGFHEDGRALPTLAVISR